MPNDDTEYARLLSVWKQDRIPVVLRRTGLGEKIRLRLPPSDGNKDWLQAEKRIEPTWNRNHRCWEAPKAWFNDIVNRALNTHGQIYIIQPFREQEVCAPACRNATGHECQCQCMGKHHGIGNDGGWFDISETFSVRKSDPQLACRLLTKRRAAPVCV